MNDQMKNTNPNGIEKKLLDVAERTNANPHFVAELESKLKDNHKPKTSWSMPLFKQTTSALGWVAFVAVLGYFLNWSFATLIPAQQPGANTTPNQFVCPVTEPNGSVPPGETITDPNYLGNGELWTVLWPNGKIYMSSNDLRPDGTLSMKWGFWRGAEGGALTVEGQRLDAEAEPLRVDIPDGYGDTGFQVLGLYFPTTGCWEITGYAGDASLTFVTEVIYDETNSAPPEPIVVTSVVTSDTEAGYDFRGTKLYITQPLPESPAEVNIYLLKEDQPATLEEARALAQRFGIQGEVYITPDLYPEATSYFITDGKQSLAISSNQYFNYTADIANAYNDFNTTINLNAETIIDDFLKSRGFDFPYRINPVELYGGYVVEPLSPDGFPMRYEFYSSRPMRVTLDDNGQVLRLEASLMDYESIGAQTYGIITAEEALQKILDENDPAGKIEGSSSSSMSQIKEWKREYPTDTPITIYGYASSIPALDSTKPAFIQIDGYTATGNTNGIDALERNTFIVAIGKFINENGIRKFNIESWKISEAQQDGVVGALRRENGQVILSIPDQAELILNPDVPADVPMPFENAFIVGVKIGNTYEWTLIDDRMTTGSGGGGGGGGGFGFYKLNLSGTPVPFPTPTQIPSMGEGEYTVQEGDTLTSIAQNYGVTVEELMQTNAITEPGIIIIGQQLTIPGAQSVQSDIGQRIEGQRGMMNITIYNKPDGSQRVEYILNYVPENEQYPIPMILEGKDLEELQAYQNRPVEIWGTVERYDELYGMSVVKVERFEFPFPDLQFQIMRGTQKNIEVNGQIATLFTTLNGVSYVIPGMEIDESLPGSTTDQVIFEALAVPDETFGGYPVLRIFSSGMAISPKNGQPVEINITADQIYMYDEPPATTEVYIPPTLTIEKVELMYFVTNQRWQVDHLESGPQYIQPVWKFTGHYSYGAEFEILVQALKQEYLLPEFAPYVQGG